MANNNKCSAALLKVGDKLSTTVYYSVVEKQPGKVVVIDEMGEKVTISNAVLERESYSTQYDEEVKVSRTAAAKILQDSGDTIFEAEFTKKDGSKRKMIGYRVGSRDTVFGRTECWECLSGKKPQKRQIDHRTLSSVVHKNKKYKVK